FVVYSTCSVLREENEQVIDAFLASKEGTNFTPAPPRAIPNPFRPQLTPHSPDPHFATRLVRTGSLSHELQPQSSRL
ncbi:MAG: hypothetical protein LBK67_12655, partial [Coriobacteriales bacterium]|nr:hypothetical protein [Coriobacteriales bacterium]